MLILMVVLTKYPILLPRKDYNPKVESYGYNFSSVSGMWLNN